MTTTQIIFVIAIVMIIAIAWRSRSGPRVTQIDRESRREKDDGE